MATTNYVWDPLNDSYLMETDEIGDTIAVYTQEPSRYGGLISQHRGTDTSYFQQDNLGSTRMLTDESVSVTDTFAYDAWGNQVNRTGLTETPFRWKGKYGYYYDEEDGEYYIRRRVYDLITARWLSADPAEFIDGLNKYRMVLVLSGSDPSGLTGEAIGNVPGVYVLPDENPLAGPTISGLPIPIGGGTSTGFEFDPDLDLSPGDITMRIPPPYKCPCFWFMEKKTEDLRTWVNILTRNTGVVTLDKPWFGLYDRWTVYTGDFSFQREKVRKQEYVRCCWETRPTNFLQGITKNCSDWAIGGWIERWEGFRLSFSGKIMVVGGTTINEERVIQLGEEWAIELLKSFLKKQLSIQGKAGR